MTFLEQYPSRPQPGFKPEAHPFDILTAQFQSSVTEMTMNPIKYAEMIKLLKKYNPSFEPVCHSDIVTEVLGNVVGAIYAPLMHGYAATVLRNIELKIIPSTVLAPPRDAIPLATALAAQAQIKNVPITILMPPINRNVTGIPNNQMDEKVPPSMHLELLFDQLAAVPGVSQGITELETGIYGTTSLVIAKELKARGVDKYVPLKFYGLGPNNSYVHAVLSHGAGWIAEQAEAQSMTPKSDIDMLMALLDTMEELGMEKYYKSVKHLTVNANRKVIPVIEPTTPQELAVAKFTNQVIHDSAKIYMGMHPQQVEQMLKGVGDLITLSKQGFPLTLTAAIPPMDSKEAHYMSMRSSGVIDYPNLVL